MLTLLKNAIKLINYNFCATFKSLMIFIISQKKICLSSVADSLKIWFIHEMTHVWQYQLGLKNWWHGIVHGCKLDYSIEEFSKDLQHNKERAYNTDISGRDSSKNFNEFNMEQQAVIIELWFDAMYLQNYPNNKTAKHHIQGIKLQGYLMNILQKIFKKSKR